MVSPENPYQTDDSDTADVLEYPLKRRIIMFFSFSVILLAAVVGMIWLKMNFDIQITDFEGLQFSAETGDKVYWAIAGCIGLVGVLALVRGILGIRQQRTIFLLKDRLQLPKNAFTTKLLSIPYSNIKKVYVKSVNMTPYLLIKLHKGLGRSMPLNDLGRSKVSDEFLKQLKARVKAANQTQNF